MDGAESELLASPFAMLKSSSEPMEPDVNLEYVREWNVFVREMSVF